MPKYRSPLKTPAEVGRIFTAVLSDDRSETVELRRYFLMLICIPISGNDLLQVSWQNISNDKKAIVIHKPAAGTLAFGQTTYPVPQFLQDLWNQSNCFGPFFPRLLAMQPKSRNAVIKAYLKEIWPYFDIKTDDFRQFFRVYAAAKSSFKPGFIQIVLSGRLSKLGHPIHTNSGINLLDWWMAEF